MDITTLEKALLENLRGTAGPRIPGTGSVLPLDVRDRRLAKLQADLKGAVGDLRGSAERIGKLPEGYPLHVRAVMHGVAALLPWYTRPLANFGRQTVQTLEIFEGVVQEIAQPESGSSAARPMAEVPFE
jgi:hypothetical protein